VIDVPSSVATHLFVYGTLRDEIRMAEVLGGGSEWRYLGPATVDGDLYDAGEYPALLLRAVGGRPVEGVLVELADPVVAFATLDVYEGVDMGLYVRRRCSARLADGSERVVWIYEYNGSVEGLQRLSDGSRPPDSWSYRPKERFEKRG
jgi:gamma-glutamylcyclotransferase (GGCT)/AIG2-like uncharacterized protein YtfP